MDIIISRDIEGSTVTVILAEADASRATVYLDKKRVAVTVWDGTTLAETAAMMLLDPWTKRAYAIMAAAIREHEAVMAGGGLAPWPDVAAHLSDLSESAERAGHVTVALATLAIAGMSLDDVAARLGMAAKIETMGDAGTWNAQEKAIVVKAVKALRAGPLNPADWQAQDGGDL